MIRIKTASSCVGVLFAGTVLAGCNGPIANKPKVPPVPAAKTEFRAQLVDFDGKKTPVEISTVLGRFRLEREDGTVFVGDLDPNGEVDAMNPKSKTFFRFEPKRYSSLFETHGRPAATRYEGALNASGIKSVRGPLLLPFKSPCDVAYRNQHKVCEWKDTGPNERTFTHEYFGRKSARQGFDKRNSRSQHVYNTKLGVITGGPSGTYLFKNIEETDIEDSRFEVPDDYQDLMSDEALADERFQYTGEPNMVEGEELEPFMNFVSQAPPPPAKPDFVWTDENWWVKTDYQRKLSISRVYPLVDFDPTKVPFNIEHWIDVKKWDEKAEVGEYSVRSKGGIVFYAKGQLFRVSAPEEHFGDEQLYLAKRIAEAAFPVDKSR